MTVRLLFLKRSFWLTALVPCSLPDSFIPVLCFLISGPSGPFIPRLQRHLALRFLSVSSGTSAASSRGRFRLRLSAKVGHGDSLRVLGADLIRIPSLGRSRRPRGDCGGCCGLDFDRGLGCCTSSARRGNCLRQPLRDSHLARPSLRLRRRASSSAVNVLPRRGRFPPASSGANL